MYKEICLFTVCLISLQEIHDTVLRLVRTADQLMHSATYDAEGIKQRLKNVDTKCEEFMHKLNTRRKNLAMSTSFFSLAQTVRLTYWMK